jgi:ribosomal protein L31E
MAKLEEVEIDSKLDNKVLERAIELLEHANL